ncbi:hypothetical protein WDZ92_05380 [Nostoc sp. NIES-2111]
MNHFSKLLLCAALFISAAPSPAESPRGCNCRPSMLRGTYVLTISGTRPAPRILPGITATPGAKESVLGIFLHTFDGRGGFHQEMPITVKGEFSGLFPDQPGSGTYEVAANCQGSFTVNLPQLPAPLQVQMAILDNGKRLQGLVVSPQALMIHVEGKRIAP